MNDAEYVVRAIQDTTYALKEPDDLLPLVKSCQDYDDAVRGIQNLEETSRTTVGELSQNQGSMYLFECCCSTMTRELRYEILLSTIETLVEWRVECANVDRMISTLDEVSSG